MKIGYLGKQDSFAVEMLRGMKAGNPQDEFLTWPPGEKPPARDLEVLLAVGKVGVEELDGQTKLGLVQTASAGYDGVDVQAATNAGIWVASAPTTKTGNGESVAEFAVLLMLAASRRLNEELAFTRDSEQTRPEKPEGNMALYGKTVCIVCAPNFPIECDRDIPLKGTTVQPCGIRILDESRPGNYCARQTDPNGTPTP